MSLCVRKLDGSEGEAKWQRRCASLGGFFVFFGFSKIWRGTEKRIGEFLGFLVVNF